MTIKNSSGFVQTISDDIRQIYNSDKGKAEVLIENYLKEQLASVSPEEKIELLTKLAKQFKIRSPNDEKSFGIETKELSRLFSLLLGKEIFEMNLSPDVATEKLAESLNTLFETLNRIVRIIHTTLFGENAKYETIRHVIGANIGKEEGTESLQSYLKQIQGAFLVSHKAFQQAASNKVGKILDELDPNIISETMKGGLKFGAFRKAEIFDCYKDKFQKCKNWFDSGRFNGELLREFEKLCQKLYKTENKR